MKFNFKIQQYQTDAVDAVVKVFNGQGFHDKISYIHDLGKMKSADMQMTLGLTGKDLELYDPTNDNGYKTEKLSFLILKRKRSSLIWVSSTVSEVFEINLQ